MAEYASVITIRNGVVEDETLFVGDSQGEVATQAEASFLAQVDLGDELSDHELENVLDDGYFEVGDCVICLVWPKVLDTTKGK